MKRKICTYKEFISFLNEQNCKKAFDDAFHKQCPGYHLDANLWDILGGDECFLGRAFDWTETEQGREFWAVLDRQWYSRCMDSNMM